LALILTPNDPKLELDLRAAEAGANRTATNAEAKVQMAEARLEPPPSRRAERPA
jgi:hypothetical protein